MGLSPGENPVTYRDREIVRYLKPQLEKAIRLGFVDEAVTIRETIDYHERSAVAAESVRTKPLSFRLVPRSPRHIGVIGLRSGGAIPSARGRAPMSDRQIFIPPRHHG